MERQPAPAVTGPAAIVFEIEQVRSCIRSLRATLLPGDGPAPEAAQIAAMEPTLELAVAGLRGILAKVPETAGSAPVREALATLRAEIAGVARLVGHAALWHAGWARVLALASGGYTAAGEPAALQTPPRLSVEG